MTEQALPIAQARELVQQIDAAVSKRAMTLALEVLAQEHVPVNEDLTVVLEAGVAAGMAGMWAELGSRDMIRAPR